jgi:hypothetical protein
MSAIFSTKKNPGSPIPSRVRIAARPLSGRADERDRAKFAKAQSYMVRRDDMVMCKNIRCRKRFEVAGVQSVAFLN